jgi:hypothetical protein
MNKPDEEAALLKDYVMIVDLTRQIPVTTPPKEINIF